MTSISSALDRESTETGQAGHIQRSFIERASAALPNGLSSRSALPNDQKFIASEGRGARVIDLSGAKYVDYHAGAGALILGHNEPTVVSAVHEQVAAGAVFFGSISTPAIRLAERLITASPCAEKMFFATTGSEATAYALRLARAATRRSLVLKFDGSYHGNHDGVLAKGGGNDGFGSPESAGVLPDTASKTLIATYNDIEATRSLLRKFESEIAAIIVEPIQKYIFPQPGFLEGLRELATETGALLIFDEVVTGFRLAYGGAQEYFGVTADLACYGKIIGGGFPLAAVAGPARIIDLAAGDRRDRSDYVLLNGTHHANPIAAAAGLATLDRVSAASFHTNLHGWTAELRSELQKVAERHHAPVSIVGGASIWDISTLSRPATRAADLSMENQPLLSRIDRELVARRCFVLRGNRRVATAAHGHAELDDTIRAFDGACRAIF